MPPGSPIPGPNQTRDAMTRMRAAVAMVLLALGACAHARPAAAPEPAQEEIMAASLQALRAGISGKVVIDPRIAAYDVRGRVWVGSWPRAQARAFARVLGGEVAEAEDVTECSYQWQEATPTPRRCAMRNADVHLALSRPVIRGDVAGILAYASADDDSGSLRKSRVIRLELRREAGAWSVRSSRVISRM